MGHIDLDEIEMRVNAAIAGPWHAHPEEAWPGRCNGITTSDRWGPRVVTTDCGYYEPDMVTAEFIAHAREDVPALLSEVRRLRAREKSLVEVLKTLQFSGDMDNCTECGGGNPDGVWEQRHVGGSITTLGHIEDCIIGMALRGGQS